VTDVSRETDVPDADTVSDWFGPRSSLVHTYAELLTGEGVRRGLLGPREAGRLWRRHILNCAVVHPLIAGGACVGDLGSGAGLPGVVLALARPDLQVTLIEPLLRRCRFLQEVVEALGALGAANLRVVRSRAEDLPRSAQFDVVTARAVAPLDRLAGWALPLCRPGGELLALKGSAVGAELHAAERTLARLRAGRVVVETCGQGVVDPLTTVVRIQSSGPLV
jgi:16S rRNA (guanine527-N7)-methyltransferase